MKKKGLSPVIATVLLILLVVILSVMIFLWGKSFVQETVQKNGNPYYQICEDISLQAFLSGKQLQIINQGNIPIYNLELKLKGGGSIETVSADKSVGLGKSETIDLSGRSFDEVEVFPIFMGTVESGTTHAYTCENGQTAETM